jgi:hypothetical protein
VEFKGGVSVGEARKLLADRDVEIDVMKVLLSKNF